MERMKKYVKPDVYFENFELSQNVATCQLQINSADATSCQIIVDNAYGVAAGGFVSTPVCQFEFEDYCYTDSTGEVATVFQS